MRSAGTPVVRAIKKKNKGKKPGLGQVWLSSAIAFGKGEEDLISINPERVFYKECVISVGCRFKGREALMISYIWVDKDFTLIRGWIQGFPKRLGNIQLSFEKRHLYAMNAALGEFGDGTRVRGYIESHGERLVTGTATLGRKITPDELAAPCKRGFMQIQHFPDIELGSQRPLVNRLVDHSVDVRFGDIWEARDVSLTFGESEIEELHMLQPREITSAYLVNIGITVRGARVLHQFDSAAKSASEALSPAEIGVS